MRAAKQRKKSFASRLFGSVLFRGRGRSWVNSHFDMKQRGKGTCTGEQGGRGGGEEKQEAEWRCGKDGGKKLIVGMVSAGGENWERLQGDFLHAAESQV